MTYLIAGLVVFLGMHSVRIVADDFRARTVARIGLNAWKAVYSVVSIAGFVLLVWGYGLSRAEGGFLWHPPRWTNHVAALFMLVSFVLLAAAYVPGNRIKARVGHPMVAAVKLWAFAHLLANGRAGDVVLFGAFLAWAIADFIAARRRDRAAGTDYPVLGLARDAITVAGGVVAYAVFALWLHVPLIGVRPY
ncbi:MAG: NnrU family protein [Burkholderiales bacterium]|nr:NnrU family protein [Burkholderiales bacterium]